MLVKEMLLRSLENPNALSQFLNWLVRIYSSIMNTIFIFILIVCIVSCIISILVNTESHLGGKFDIRNLKQYVIQRKNSLKDRFTKDKVWDALVNRFLKVKLYLWKCRYFLVWYIWVCLSWFFVSFGYWFIGKFITLPWWCSEAENWLLWMGAMYTLILFVIASIFITFCFWSKFVRNIWVFIYILGVCLLFMRWFLSLWCQTIW